MAQVAATKLDLLGDILRRMGSVLVAYSGGVDSTVLAKVAHDVLGPKAVALTAHSPSLAAGELQEAQAIARRIGIRHVVVQSHELEDARYAANPSNRCFFCKSELFDICLEKMRELGLAFVAEGSQADDVGDHRPGFEAAKQRGVRSPLLEAGIGKAELRAIGKGLGLANWDKPEAACLASRFPTGVGIDAGKLSRVDACEKILKDLGFRQIRARFHGDMVRIEAAEEELPGLLQADVRETVLAGCRGQGFKKVVVDLEGYKRKK